MVKSSTHAPAAGMETSVNLIIYHFPFEQELFSVFTHLSTPDLSPSLFQNFAPIDQGVIPVSWDFMPQGFQP